MTDSVLARAVSQDMRRLPFPIKVMSSRVNAIFSPFGFSSS